MATSKPQPSDVALGLLNPNLAITPPALVAYTDTAGTSPALTPAGYYLCVCTTDAYVVTGTAPTATATETFVQAGERFPVHSPAGATKVSAIQVSSGGTLHCMRLL